MAGHGMSNITVARLHERMVNRFGYLHYNDQCNGRHASEYDFLEEMLADEIVEDEGSFFCVMEDAEQLDRNSAPVETVHSCEEDTAGVGGASRPVGGSSPQLLTGGFHVPNPKIPRCFPLATYKNFPTVVSTGALKWAYPD